MTARVVGALALEYLSDAGAIGVSARKRAALADLRALMAQAETYRAERDRLRAALDDANRGNERLSADLDSVRHAHIAAMAQRDKMRAALRDAGEVCAEVHANTENRQSEPYVAYVRKAMAVAAGYAKAALAECGGDK